MSLPNYPEYKASGVEWLGEVPRGWAVRPLKHLARLQTGMTPPTDDLGNYTEDDVFQWVRPEDLNETGTPTKASKFLTEQGWLKTRQITAGASLICCIGTIGKVGITNTAVSTNQQITAAVPREDCQYLFYAICSGRAELELASTGNVLRILNTERLGNISFPNPPLVEQTQIAAFLDRETGKIDALITEQRRLVELLQERRSALISAAVTGKIDVREQQV
ncbi:MAG: restriction endonuclease subunit S [Gallionella sp.]|nr:restriction endonuclease subunit S [Gallionella sp.]